MERATEALLGDRPGGYLLESVGDQVGDRGVGVAARRAVRGGGRDLTRDRGGSIAFCRRMRFMADGSAV